MITDRSVDEEIRSVKDKLAAEGIQVTSAAEENYSLEDVFIALVEKARSKGNVGSES